MNVAKTMRDLLPEIKKGHDCIRFPDLRPTNAEHWSEKYAMLGGMEVVFAGGFPPNTEYFDESQVLNDFEFKVRAMFPGCSVNFYWPSQEIEVMRA